MIPMLARTLGPKFNTFPCYVQPKLNGVRALFQWDKLGLGTFQSRDEKIWGESVLEHLIQELRNIKDHIGNNILDGELYVHGWRLQRINKAIAVNRHKPIADTASVEFHVFDVVNPTRMFSERWLDVYNTLRNARLRYIKPVPTDVCSDRAMLDLHFHHYTKLGYEGIMLRPDGPYVYGEHMAKHGQNMTSYRSMFLWKHKLWVDGEFCCIGVTQGVGKAEIGVGALTLCTQSHNGNNAEAFNVGTGFTDEERADYMVNPPIGKLVKIRYLCLTADGIPFNPSFLCVM